MPSISSNTEPSRTSSSSLPSSPPNTFSTLISRQISQVDEDNEDDQPVRAAATEWTSIPISELFDFTNDAWTKRYEQFAHITFDEELALYDLLEEDADGELDPDFGAVTEDILADGGADDASGSL